MKGWRTKFISLLIVYFAGFATAIYFLAPTDDDRSYQPITKAGIYSTLKSDEFAKSFNNNMHRCIGFGKDTVWRMGKYLKQKLEEKELRPDG